MKTPTIIICLMLSSCTMHSIPDRVTAPVDVPGSFSEQNTGTNTVRKDWWVDFGDEQLNKVISKARSDNLDLKQAYSRLSQAHALSRQAGSALWPQIQVEGTYRKSKNSMFLGDDFPFGDGVLETTTTTTPISVGVAYELDVWGRTRSLTNSTALQLAASTLDLKALDMTLTAQITEVWFLLAEVKSQWILLQEQLEVNRTMLELVKLRFSRGLASALDVHQQKVQLQGLEARIPLNQAREQLLENQLAVHMGQAPGSFEIDEGVKLPTLQSYGGTGLPSEMLRMRPDVRAAELRVRAAHAQVAAAIADRFPRVSLAGSYGVPGHKGRPLFENFVWNLVGNIVAPVFDGGRRSAEVDRQRAVVEELVTAYGKTVLVALREVEDALVSERSQKTHVGQLVKQLETAKLSLEVAKVRYMGGLIDYLPVLGSLQSVQQLERMLLTARRGQLSYRVQLYRALGGGTLVPEPKPATATEQNSEGAGTQS